MPCVEVYNDDCETSNTNHGDPMRIEELEAAQFRSHELLNLNSGVHPEIFDDVRKFAYNLVDDALQDAIRQLKIHRDRDQNSMASRYG